MANVNRIGCLADEFAAVADFVTVYIEEAHPVDGWAFKGDYDIATHRTVDERIAAAGLLAGRDGRVPVVVDAMSDDANRAYGALFERLYIVQNGTVVYQGQRGPHGFRVAEVEQWLRNYRVAVSQTATVISAGSGQSSVVEIPDAPNPC